MKLTASAPGKLVLLGEYAVLHGAPALVMAADRRATVTLESEPGSPEFSIETLAPERIEARFRLDDRGAVRWLDPGAHEAASRLGLVTWILDALGPGSPGSESQGMRLAPFRASLATAEFFDTAKEDGAGKLGLGSSAALTVAFACALLDYTGRSRDGGDDNATLSRLLDIHRGYQRGRGSGVDVAASLHGGVILFHVGQDGEIPEVEPVSLPDGLGFVAVWSGRPASTGAYLERLEAWRQRDAAGFERAIGDLAGIAVTGANAARARDAGALLEAFDEYGSSMRRMGSRSGLDIFSTRHERIASIARACGSVYKPSGAGGGDIGLAFGSDADALERTRREIESAGFKTLTLNVDPVGLQVQRHSS